MDPFWTFVGSYWWLAFPLGGVIVGGVKGISKSMELSADRRHQRKMEALRVKAQIKTAEIEARGQNPRAAHRPLLAASAEPVNSDLLQRILNDHDDITKRWLDYELDVAKLIAFPAMSDGRQPLTAAFLRAKKTADALRPVSAKAKITEQQVAEYMDAVGNYAVAFEIAERDARRLRDSTFTEPERKRLDRAQQLLKVAIDDSATQAERNLAYKRVREELDGLILLSDQAVTVLENQVARELPSAGSPATDLLPPQSPPDEGA